MLPRDMEELERVRKGCKILVTKRACIGAAAALMPVPGCDIAVDVALITELVRTVSKRFGLTEQDLDKYDTWTRLLIYDLIKRWGTRLVGDVVTKEIIIQVIKKLSLRITVAQVLKYIPFVGQATSAGVSAVAVKCVGNAHIADCYRIVRRVILEREGKTNPVFKLLLYIPFRMPWF